MTIKYCVLLFTGIIFIAIASCKHANNKSLDELTKELPKTDSIKQVKNTDEQKKDTISNRIIDPNGKVGLITASTTKLELAELYGKENISDTIVFSYEGIDVVGSLVSFENNNDNLYIFWNEDNLIPKTIIIKNKNSNWKTKDGIGIGSTLKDVEKANGKPFDIHPLAEIDAYLTGTVRNWNSGSFTNSGLNIQFKITKDLPDLPMEEYMKMIEGGLSNNNMLEKLDLQVETISISFQ